MSLSTLLSLHSPDDKIAQIDAEIARLEDELHGNVPATRPEGQTRALLAVARRKRRWYETRRDYLASRSAA